MSVRRESERMGRVAFTVEVSEEDAERTAKAMAYELHISPKHAFEICRAIKGMLVEDAERFLEAVIAKEKPVPFLSLIHISEPTRPY